ncbi:MAG: YceI family protein [Planctomycetota bacterium]
MNCCCLGLRCVAVLLATAGVATAIPMIGATAVAQAKAPAPTTATSISFPVYPMPRMALFRVHHLFAGQFWGRFNDVTGSFSFEPGKAEGMNFDISISTESVDSGNEDLDKHLRSPDFFAAKDFPKMTFRSTGAKKTGERTYELMGELTMRGVTKPVTAALEFCGMSDKRGPKAGFEAQFAIKRSEFGVSFGIEQGTIGDDVRVIVGLEGGLKK